MMQLIRHVLRAFVRRECRCLEKGAVQRFQTFPTPPFPLQILPDQMQHPDQRLLPSFAIHRQRYVLGIKVGQQLFRVRHVVTVHSTYEIFQHLEILRHVAAAHRRQQTIGILKAFIETSVFI